MAAALVCAVTAAALSLSADRSQHFTIDGFTVTCPSASWSVYRSTGSDSSPSQCNRPWGRPKGEGCLVGPTLLSDSGLYWCQDKDKQCTPQVNITVSDRKVILESPFFPVKEGQNVTLSCYYREEEHLKRTSDFAAAFFKNDKFLGRFTGGEMVLSPVTKADEGMYKCEHPSKVQSLESQLIVLHEEKPPVLTPTRPPPREISLYRILIFVFLFILYTSILCIGLCICRTWARARAEEKKQDPECRASLRRIRNP